MSLLTEGARSEEDGNLLYSRSWQRDESQSMNEPRYRAVEQRLWASVGVTPTERRLPLARNGVTVRVQEVGDGPPVIFIHGANTSGLSWAALVARMQGFRCILLDRPGTGLSEPLSDPLDAESLPRLADTLVVDVLDALGLPSAHVVGNSYGGFIAFRSAAAHPDRIDRVVQFSWPVGAATDRLPIFMRLAGIPGLSRLSVALPPSERMVRFLFGSMGHGPSLSAGRLENDVEAYLGLLRYTDTMRNELSPARVFVSPLRGLDRFLLPDDTMRAITAPVYLLWGEKDPFGGETAARRLHALLPNAELELMPGAGHAPWLDDVEHCADVANAFLSGPAHAALPLTAR